MKDVRVSMLFGILAAVLFAVGAIVMDDHSFENVTFDLMLGLTALALAHILP